MHILFTGGTGFIGSHCVLELLQSNYTVTVISSLVNSATNSKGQPISLQRVEALTKKKINYKKVDLLNLFELEEIFKNDTFDVVMHFASLKGVGESCKEPLKFYYNNIIGSLNLISMCKKYNLKNVIFSSSVAVYGAVSEKYPLKEEAAISEKIPSPYGQTKFMIENMLKDISKSDKEWNIICLRYCVPVGAHPSGVIGEDFSNGSIPSNLMPYICQVINGELPFLTIFGNDFNTPDGTCVRDYIHVMDAARANIAAFNRIIKGKSNVGFEIYNIGSGGKGYSVAEMIRAMEEASGKKVPTKIMPHRPGDVEYICSDSRLAEKNLQWKAEFTLNDMCRDLVNWLKMNPNGYLEDDVKKDEKKTILKSG